ncbi:MAG: LolA family protein [Flavobacterium sp.]
MKNLVRIVVVLISMVAFSQNSDKAKKLLDEVTANAKSQKNIDIEFKYTLQNTKEKINQDSKGRVIMEGNKYHLSFMGITKIFDGKQTYTISPEDEEVTISKTDDNDPNAITPNKILNFFQSGYKYQWDIEQNIKGRIIQYIKLIPISSKDTRKEILLGIDTRTKQIYNLIEVDKNNTRTTLTVVSFKTNQVLPKNQFTFEKEKYANYYINKVD